MGTNASPQSTVPKADSKNKQGIATGNTPVLPVPADWNKFQSKDIPPYFNYGHIYHYSLQSLKDVTPVDDDGDNPIDHMTDKPPKNTHKYVDSGYVRKKRKENLIDFDQRPETHSQVTTLQSAENICKEQQW